MRADLAQIVVTRTEPGASETAARLAAAGDEVIKTPAIRIETFEPEAGWAAQSDEIVIFTSANGVRCFVGAGWTAGKIAVCVGPSTTAAALDAGFDNVINTDGNADVLVEAITEQFDPSADKFVHYANSAAAGEICAKLNASGYTARFVPLYGADAVPWDEVCHVWACLAETGFIILVHSAKAAKSVNDWIGQADIDTSVVRLVAISDHAARPLLHHEWQSVWLAEHPNENKLMEALHLATKDGVLSE